MVEKKETQKEIVKEEPIKEETKPVKKEESSNMGTYLILILVVAGALGIGYYYFKVVKKKENEELEALEDDADDFFSEADANVRILSSKLLKAKEQIKKQEEKKESVLGAIKKYKAEEKAKPVEKERIFKGNGEIEYVGVVLGMHRFFYCKISSRKKKIILLKVLLLCYNRNGMILGWIRLEDNHVKTKL